MTNQNIPTPQIFRHVGRHFTGVGTRLPLTDILYASHQLGATQGDHRIDIQRRRNDNHLDTVIKTGNLLADLTDQLLHKVFRPVHLPVSSYDLATHTKSQSSRPEGGRTIQQTFVSHNPPHSTKSGC